MATRGQVKRALEWIDWSALKPKVRERKKTPFPRCVTCGGEADGTFIAGQPRYRCRHEPIRIDDETLERGQKELRPERESV